MSAIYMKVQFDSYTGQKSEKYVLVDHGGNQWTRGWLFGGNYGKMKEHVIIRKLVYTPGDFPASGWKKDTSDVSDGTWTLVANSGHDWL